MRKEQKLPRPCLFFSNLVSPWSTVYPFPQQELQDIPAATWGPGCKEDPVPGRPPPLS